VSELDLRASDGDRERAIDDLRAHTAAGRLTVEELEERVQPALGARTHAELVELTRDLPDRASATPPGPPHRRRPARREVRTFLAMMVLLVAIWAVAGAGHPWPLWPMLGWGFFVLRPREQLGFHPCHPSVSSRR
jgi:fatty acid desaturase